MSGEITVKAGVTFTTSSKVTAALLNQLLGDAVFQVDAGAITARELADGEITSDKLDANLSAQLGIPDGSITNAKIVDLTITDAKIATGTLTLAKMAAPLHDVVVVEDQKTFGTNGGTFSTGAWRKRDLNTIVLDAGGHASLASSVITLAAGTWDAVIRAPAMDVGGHRIQLVDTTSGASVLAWGTAEYTPPNTVEAATWSVIETRFTISVSSTLEVRHKGDFTSDTDRGFGKSPAWSADPGEKAIYTRVHLKKVK